MPRADILIEHRGQVASHTPPRLSDESLEVQQDAHLLYLNIYISRLVGFLDHGTAQRRKRVDGSLCVSHLRTWQRLFAPPSCFVHLCSRLFSAGAAKINLLVGSRADLDGKLNVRVLGEQVILPLHADILLEPATLDDALKEGPEHGVEEPRDEVEGF